MAFHALRAGDRPALRRGAADRGADAIILDLEDSIPPGDKARARELLPDAVVEVGRRSADVLVRVNRPWRLLVRDLEACIIAGVRALKLPKVESAEHVAAVAEIVDELEAERGLPRGGIGFVPMIETAAAVFRIQAIAASHPRVVAITVGAEDLALSVGMLPEAEGLFLPKQLAIIAARAAGILPLGFLGTVAEYRESGGVSRHHPPLAPAGLCRRGLHPSRPDRRSESGVPAGGGSGGTRRAADRRL